MRQFPRCAATAATILVGFVVWQEHMDDDPGRLRTALSRTPALVHGPGPDRGAASAAGERQRQAGWPRTWTCWPRTRSPVATGDGAASASTDTERSLCEVFAEQFNGVVPHLDDDFFSFGLDSIVAISLVHKARRRGLTLSPRMVFTAATIRQLAAAIDGAAGSDAGRRERRIRCGAAVADGVLAVRVRELPPLHPYRLAPIARRDRPFGRSS